MKITTKAFANGSMIPDRYSRYHDNCSPPLDFSEVPSNARSLVLIMDDPDAPGGLFTHWVVFAIEANVGGFGENQVPRDVRYGLNSWGEAGYGGPRPPDREHRYFFRLFALDRRLSLQHGAHRNDVEKAMKGHVVAQAEMMGRYAPPT